MYKKVKFLDIGFEEDELEDQTYKAVKLRGKRRCVGLKNWSEKAQDVPRR